MAESGPVFSQVNLVVRDIEATVAFYRRLGVTIRDTDPEWDLHHRSVVMPDGLDLDLDSEEFARQWNRGSRGASAGSAVLGFRVASRDAVDSVYEDLTTAGYVGQQPPYDAFFGARYAVVEDPDGNPVGLMSPIDPERKTMQAAPGARPQSG